MTVRFGILGTNFISDWFCEALARVAGARAVAVFSRTQARGADFAARHGIGRVYTTLEALLADAEVDAVYVATPNMCHAPMTRAALCAGKHALVEKPITETAAQLSELRALASERGLVLLEAMRPDFDPAYDALREALGRIGRVRRVSLSFCQYSSRYDAFRRGEVLNAFNPAMGNCALADIGIYPLHVAVSLFGVPSRVTGQSVFLDNGFEGAGQLLLDYTYRGFTATVSYSKISDGYTPSVIEGEQGTLTVDKLTEPHRIELCTREGRVSVYASGEGNMHHEVAAFCSMLRGERSYQTYLGDTYRTMCLFDEIVREGRVLRR